MNDAEIFIYWPQRHNFAHADCLPGPSTVGYIVMQGAYLRDMTWSLSSEECATVPVEEPSWDAVKAFYR